MRNYPKVPRTDVKDTYFGVTIEDPYRYLEDKKAPEVLDIVAQENAYTKAFFDNQPEFHWQEVEKRLREKPVHHALSGVQEACGCRCASRKLDGGMHDIVTLDENDQVSGVLMNDAMMDDRMHVYSAKPCPTHAGIYAIMGVKHGAPRCCIVVYDANAKRVIAELDDVFGFNWSEDGEGVLYSSAVVDTQNNRNINRVHRFDWQSEVNHTLYVYPDNAVFIGVSPAPKGGCFLGVKVNYGDTLMLYLNSEGKATRLSSGKGFFEYIGEKNGRCYFSTDENAPMGHVLSIAAKDVEREGALVNGFAVALAETDASLESVGLTDEGILAVHSRNACSEMALYSFEGKKLREIAMPSEYGAISTGGTMEVSDEGNIFFGFQSFTMKPVLLKLNVHTFELTAIDKEEDRDTSDITVSQCFLKARDGERILVYLVHKKDLVKDGNTPTLMYGYGGYFNILSPMPENMSGYDIVEWARKGRIYAHCILRGGGEYGTKWHEAGMKLNKKNAFYDFIDIAEWLVEQGYTRPAKIVANGASNGGLLMAAISTLRPDLFGTVIASVPHTDMIRFRNDDRGMMYVTEYGDPLENEETLKYMLSYSPYHNIKPGTLYPRLLVQTGENDNNVPPYHGKKFAIRLQHDADERHPVLLTVLAHGSHDRGVGEEYYYNIAQMQTFVEIGLAEAERESK